MIKYLVPALALLVMGCGKDAPIVYGQENIFSKPYETNDLIIDFQEFELDKAADGVVTIKHSYGNQDCLGRILVMQSTFTLYNFHNTPGCESLTGIYFYSFGSCQGYNQSVYPCQDFDIILHK